MDKLDKLKENVRKEFKRIDKDPRRIGDLIAFHARHKYLFFCYDIPLKDMLGQELGQHNRKNLDLTYRSYSSLLDQLFSKEPGASKLKNSLHHMYGYIRTDINQEDKEVCLGLIDKLDDENDNFTRALEIIYSYAQATNKKYLLDQSLFRLIRTNPNESQLVKKAKAFPKAPGIYRFYSQGNVFYVGKSKNLASRIGAYFRPRKDRKKLYTMMERVDDLDYIQTRTHLEARILEFKMIRDLKPLYNSQFKKAKGVYYMTFDEKNIVSWSPDGGIGPFIGSKFIRKFKDQLEKILPLGSKQGILTFDYQVFTQRLGPNEKKNQAKILQEIFSSPESLGVFQESLEEKMLFHGSKLEFERAQFFKNLLESVTYISGILGEKNAFLEGDFIFEEDGFLSLISNGKLVYISNKISLEDLRKAAKDLIAKDPSPDYSFDLKSLVYSHSKEDGVRVYRV